MKKELELYLHIPFCVRKCAYCDFLSFPAEKEIQKQYVNCLIEEIRQFDPVSYTHLDVYKRQSLIF